jgi:hypothetical protein
MKIIFMAALLLFPSILLFDVLPASAQEFTYSVSHQHTMKDCRGVLKITMEGIEYTTAGKDSRKWTFDDIRTIEVKSPTKVLIISYEDQKRWMGKDKVFEFNLLDKKATPELSAFLLAHVKRPMKLAVFPDVAEKPVYELPVKHLHAVTGSRGVLRIYPDKVLYWTEVTGDSRYWRMHDIERFSQPDRFRFQIVSYVPETGGPTESYDFQLMQDLPDGLYDYVWVRLHPSTYYPAVER